MLNRFRYFDLAADNRSDVIQVYRWTADIHVALALGTSGFFCVVTIAIETLELVVNDLQRTETLRGEFRHVQHVLPNRDPIKGTFLHFCNMVTSQKYEIMIRE